jgi:transcriptional regulator with XRE-family HTH domain
MAREAGITRVTLTRLEQGDPSVTAGTFLKVLDALSLADDLGHVAADEDKRSPNEKLRRRRVPRTVRLGAYPQLMGIAWHLADKDMELTPEEAFALYERNWRHVDLDRLLPKERALIDGLTATVGKGVLLV